MCFICIQLCELAVFKLIVALWHHMASDIWVIGSSMYSVSTRSNADLLSIKL